MSDPRDRLVCPPAAPSAHLTDAEIAAADRRHAHNKHLADCAWCRSRLAAFEDDGSRDELDELLAELAVNPASESAVEVAARWSVPQPLADLLGEDQSLAPAVSPGQLWRLSWSGENVLVVVVNQRQWWTRVAPLTTDVLFADEYSLLVESSDTSLGQRAVVFTRAAATVPTFTLSQFLGDLTVSGAPSGEMLEDLDSACLRGVAPGDSLPTGHRLSEDDWESHELLDALQSQMYWFQAAVNDLVDLEPEGDGATEAVGVQEVLIAASRVGTSLSELADRTGLTMARILDLMGGRSQPTAGEQAQLAMAFGRAVTSGLPPQARNALIEVASEPRLRPLRCEFNRRLGEPTADPSSVAPLVARLWEEGVAARSVPSSSGSAVEEGWRARWRARLAYLQQQM